MDGWVGSWHLGDDQTGSSTNKAGFHLSYLIRGERRLAFPLQEQCLFSDTSLYEPHALEATTRSPSPLHNPEQPAAAITAPLCLCPEQKLPTTLCSWKSPDQPSPSPTQVPGDKAVQRPNGVQKQSWDYSHMWFGLFFVPGKPPHTPNSAILRLSGWFSRQTA